MKGHEYAIKLWGKCIIETQMVNKIYAYKFSGYKYSYSISTSFIFEICGDLFILNKYSHLYLILFVILYCFS